ncbi:hypothetical protein KKB3_01561 [Dehalococcoides mccartyi]|nr:hypothetical protein KKB3_01561 [Dehalococcoides mccartyi]
MMPVNHVKSMFSRALKESIRAKAVVPVASTAAIRTKKYIFYKTQLMI